MDTSGRNSSTRHGQRAIQRRHPPSSVSTSRVNVTSTLRAPLCLTTLVTDGQFGGHRTARDHRRQRPGQPAIGQDRRVHRAQDVPELGHRVLGAFPGLGQPRGDGLRIALQLTLGQPQPHRDGHETRLRAVVRIAFDPAQLGAVRIERPRPGDLQGLDALDQHVACRRGEQARAQPGVDVGDLEREQQREDPIDSSAGTTPPNPDKPQKREGSPVNLVDVHTPDLDSLDYAILEQLQADARTIAETIGVKVGLSAAAVQRRIKRLREAGVIHREVAVLDPVTLGLPMTFIVLVEMERETHEILEAFRRQVLDDDSVQQCYYVTGTADFALVITCRDMTGFEAFAHRVFVDNPDVRHFTTSVVMDRVKVGLTLPLEPPC